MQTISTGLRSAINATSSRPLPRVLAEWNYNRFIEGITVSNPAGSRNEKIWPINSLIQMRNANSGISRAIVGQAKAYSKQATQKFHVVSENDSYKYWASPTPSASDTSLTGCVPTVNYNRVVAVNKIVVRFDVGYAAPDAVTTYILDGSGNPVSIGTKLPDSTGKIVYYYNGTWGNTVGYASSTNITGVRVSVTSMNKAAVNCHMIEISARREIDLSVDVESFSVSKVYEEQDLVLPVGAAAANTCNLSLANDHGHYDPENTASPYYGLLEENVLFDVSVGYDTGAGVEYIQQGYFYSNSWGVSTDSITVTVDCTDGSKFLQETYVTESLFQKIYGNPGEAPYRVIDVVRELLARVGYQWIRFNVNDPSVSIPFIWYRDEVTVWEALNDIAQAVPATFYFDEFNNFIWQDVDFTYSKSTPVHTVDYDVDLIDASHDFSVVSNHVTVRYNTYGVNQVNNQPITSELWSPDGDVVLRVAELEGTISDTATHLPLLITETDFATWPNQGLVRIGNERIRYSAKTQIKDSTAPHYRTDIHPALLDLERGVLGTTSSTHSLTIGGTLTSMRLTGGTRGISNGYLRLATPWDSNYKGYLFNMFGTLSTYEKYYSTRIMFTDPCRHNIGGLTIHQSGEAAGYYLELTPTTFASQYNHGEIRMYKMDAAGTITELVRTGDMRGVHASVTTGVWYRLEIKVVANQFTCYVNGSLVGAFQDSTYTAGQFAPYLRGHSVANYEYVMAGTSVDASRIELYQTSTIGGTDSTYSGNQTGTVENYYEFGNLVHEGREFSVEYDVYPALGARVFNSNNTESVVVNKSLGPFRGSFIVENHSRTAAVLSGEDTINEIGQTLSHHLLLYGQAIIRASEEVKVLKNEESIRRRGRQEVEISTPWIEEEEGANRVAKHIINRWSSPIDIINVNWVPNPALQIGDLVAVNYPAKGFESASHHYFVLGIELSWDSGVSSSLVLRRKR